MKRFTVLAGIGMALAMASAQAAEMGYGTDSQKPMAKEEMHTAQPAVTIIAPTEGAMLTANQPVTISYQATPGPKGDHVHLYVDGERVAVLKQLSGDYQLKNLSPGKHKIRIDIVTQNHQPIGVGSEITVEVR